MAIQHCRSGEVSTLGVIDDVATRTVALVHTPSFEAIRLVVRADESNPAHQVAGSMTLYCIAGHVRFEGSSPMQFRAGEWLFVDPGTSHAVAAVEDSSLLPTILFDESDGRKAIAAEAA